MTPPATRKRQWIYAPLVFGFCASTCSHGSLVLAMLLGATGRAGGSGEDGIAGGGDTSIDISVAGSPAVTASPDIPTSSPPEPTPPPKVDDVADPPQDLAAHEPAPAVTATPSRASPSAKTAGNAEVTSGGKLPGPTRIGFPNVGVDGDSVDGQRALLPAAASCPDPVAGRWEALKYNPLHGAWVHFTMTVRRSSDGVLSGTILSRTWSGSPLDRVPPPCELDGFDETVSMNAFGRADSTGKITFGATRYSIVSVQCPALDRGYAPDHFSGSIDSSREEFQSLNNDGFTDVNAPYVFRRTSCL